MHQLPALELISIHIPKTAGTSFRNVLNDVYGEEHVLRLDITEHDALLPHVKLNEVEISKSRLPLQKIKVLHGHFQRSRAAQYFNLPPEVPVITWLRNPVQRVISNYLYLRKMVSDRLSGNELKEHIFCSLLQFAARDANRNRMHRFLETEELSQFAFTGKTENFSNDLLQLKEKMNWQKIRPYNHNQTGHSTAEIDEAVLHEIELLNALDVKLYNSI